MKHYTFKDIIGPIMIGPSSSHTAGAARIALAAKQIAPEGFTHVDFHLAGSFGKTYRGHGTDHALVGGILGFPPDDMRIRESFALAKKADISYAFLPFEDPSLHSNTVIIEFHYPQGKPFFITGSSIGGGAMIITDINGSKVRFTGDLATLILIYEDQKFVISTVTSILAKANINIDSIKTSTLKNRRVVLTIELDQPIPQEFVHEIESLPFLDECTYITPMNL